MSEKLSYEEQKEISIKNRQSLYKAFQENLMKEKLNLYGFEIHINNPEDSNTIFNTSRDMYSSATLYFKDCVFGNISPNFIGKIKDEAIESLHMSFGMCAKGVLESIDYHDSERGLKQLQAQKDSHKTLQSCIDEAERIRKEAVKFYSI
ncbi:MAG TPA: hypothetical protein VMX17_02270 [Candidatus Glassbacteria bacterium]|nr:hypothetical protein [Candidatus Glassbacteria bacterium]